LIIQIVFFIYKLGVLPSLEREECKKIIECYGGRVTTAVSGKTDYLLTGRDVGKTKTDKAAKLRVPIITEDDLLKMIRTRPGKIDTDAKPTVTKPAKATVAKPIDMNSFVTVSPKFRGDKQDDGNLCKC
jgi:BRCT domain type II-containing protein